MLLRNPRLKPRQGARLNPKHWAGQPCACCLMNEGGGVPHDIGGWNAITPFGTQVWSPTGLNFNGTTTYLDLGTKLSGKFPKGEISVCGWVVPQANIKNNFVSFGPAGNAGFNFFLHEDRGNPVPLGLTYWDSASSWHQSVTNLVMGQRYFVGWTIKGTTLTFYLNGQFDGSAAVATFNPNAQPGTRIGNANSEFGKGLFESVFIYNFAMSAAQIWQIYQQPYAMFRQPRRGFFGPGSAPASIFQRRTRAPFGTRTGSRQVA